MFGGYHFSPLSLPERVVLDDSHTGMAWLIFYVSPA